MKTKIPIKNYNNYAEKKRINADYILMENLKNNS